MKSKKEKLLGFLNAALTHPQYQVQLLSIIKNLKLTLEETINEFLHYNLDIYSAERNIVYQSLSNRLVLHIHNLIEGSWHIERQQTVLNFIKLANPTTIADIGFGVPSQYVKDWVLKKKEVLLTFYDLYDSAFEFAKQLLSHWSNNWEEKISFKKTDMDEQEYVGDFDLYLIQDSIEHTIDPKSYLKKLVNSSPKNAQFIISLPIGPLFPRHYLAWENDKEGIDWLKQCGLQIKTQKNVFVNPEVDLFAEQIASNYHDLYTLCEKI